MTLQGRNSTEKKDPGSVSFKQADRSCHPLLRVISGRGEYEPCARYWCFSCMEGIKMHLHPSERCAFSGHSTSIVKLQVISHLHRTACTVINLDRQKGREIDGPSVIASFAWQSKP